MININIEKQLESDHVLEYLDYEDIHDKDSLADALDKYCSMFSSDKYKPNWSFEDLDAVIHL